ncbi:MAG: hypothetical protein DI535_09155 [Citrobacter freundii]|nr:MAG: hypothetical protein DI535_09155 [Citrobacter freundii]
MIFFQPILSSSSHCFLFRVITTVIFLVAFNIHGAAAIDTTKYQVVRYTDENGLPQNSIKAMAADEMGNIWLCTEDGLVRFNGERFEQFSRHNLSINSSRFGDFLFDATAKNLYAVNSFQEIIYLKGGKPTPDSGFYKERLRALSLRGNANANAKWDPLPAWHRGVGLYNDTVMLFTSVSGYYELTKAGVARYEGASAVWKQPLSDALPGEHFFTLGNELFRFQQNGTIQGFTGTGIHEYAVPALTGRLKDDSRIFRSTDGGSVILYNNQNFFEIAKTGGSFSCRLLLSNFDADEHVINCAYISPVTQQFFLGSATEGLYRFIPSPFMISRAETTHGFNIFYSMIEFQAGRLLASQGAIIDHGSLSKDRRPLMPQVSDKYSVVKDEDGFLWTKKDRRIYRLDADARQILDSIQISSPINCLYRGFDNQLWIGTQAGIQRMSIAKGSGSLAVVAAQLAHVTCFSESQDSTLWIGTLHGLYTLKKNSSTPEHSAALPSQYIRSIYSGTGGRTWITTYGDGFALFDNGKFCQLPLDTKGYLRSSHCIMEDHKGFFWISTNKGLFQISKEDLINYSKDRSLHPYYQYYSTEQGLNTNEFNGGCQPCAARISGGLLSFPTIDGVVSFVPDTVSGIYPSYPFTVDEVLIDNKPVRFMETLQVPRGMSQLTVRVSTANWSHPDNLRIFFALEKKGEAPVWYPVPDNRTINLTTLPTGEFTLRIRKQNGFGNTNYLEWSLPLHVPAPWFLQPVAFIVMVILAALLTGGIIRLRVRIVKRKNASLQEQIRDNTAELQAALNELTISEQALRQQTKLQQQLLAAFSHDIKAPMKHLMFTVERLSQRLQKQDTLAHSKVTESIHHHIRRLYHLMNNILQYIRSQMNGGQRLITPVSLSQVLQEKLTIFEDLAQERNTVLDQAVDTDLKVMTDELLFSIILHNLIDNAVKVTVNGVVTITAKKVASGCELTVHDTGIGMSEELVSWVNEVYDTDSRHAEQVTGLGLMIVKDLSALLQIRLKAESMPGNTMVTLFIPD